MKTKALIAVLLSATAATAAITATAGERVAATRTQPIRSAEQVGNARAADSTGRATEARAVVADGGGGGASNYVSTMVEKYRGNPDPSPTEARLAAFEDGYVTAQVIMDWDGPYNNSGPIIHVYDKVCPISNSDKSSFRVYGLTQVLGNSVTRVSASAYYMNTATNFRWLSNDGGHGNKYGVPLPNNDIWFNNRKTLTIGLDLPILANETVAYDTMADFMVGCDGSNHTLNASRLTWRQDDGVLRVPSPYENPNVSFQATVKLSFRKDDTVREKVTCPAFSKTYPGVQGETCPVNAPARLYGESYEATSVKPLDSQYNQVCSAMYSCVYDGTAGAASWVTKGEVAVKQQKPGYCQQFPDECYDNGVPK